MKNESLIKQVQIEIGKASSETLINSEFCLTPIPPKIDLRDAHAIRRELGAVYRDMRSGRIETQEGTRLAYVLDMIRKAYETAILQNRIESMERTLRHKP